MKTELQDGRGCGCKAAGGANGGGVDRQTEYRRVIESFDVFSIPAPMRAEIREALDSPLWNWFEDCDGCTCVSEVYWPTKYFPPCLRHDFDCATGHNGLATSRRFYRIQRAYGMGRIQSGARFVGVTVAWYAWMKWRT